MGNPVCLWQTELFKLNLKSSPSSSGYNRRRRLATRSSGKQQAERTAVRTAPIVCPEESPLVRPQVQNLFLAEGLTRRLRRERRGCRPDGGSYFLSTRKKVPKKACGTATPEAARPASRRGLRSAGAPSGLSSTSVRCAHPPGKRLLLPILSAGLAMSRAMELDSYHTGAERARARLFPPSKWAGLFPSAAYRRSASPQLAGGILNPCGLGCFDENWTFLQRQRPA